MRGQVGERRGRFLLESRLGQGAFGVVWKARDLSQPDQWAAVKIGHSERLVDQVDRIVGIHERLRHACVVPLLDAGREPVPGWLAFELVDGVSLETRLLKGPLPLRQALAIFRDVVEALQAAHAVGVLHRDLKPSNILLPANGGRARLADWGCALVREPVAEGLAHSLEGLEAEEMAGTVHYMAPEQLAGEAVDERTDLYAAGVVLFEMLVGERPQPGDRPSDFRGELPGRVNRLFSSCYERRERRVESATEMMVQLEALLDGRPLSLEDLAVRCEVDGADWTIDRFCVTNLAYQEYVSQTGAPPPGTWTGGTLPPGRGFHPVAGVTRTEAMAYARWAGARLPTADEWELAAGGAEGRAYPWGEEFEPGRANTKERRLLDTSPVGECPAGRTPSGIDDLCGNVWEWTATDRGDDQVILKGGSFFTPKERANVTFRGVAPLDTRSPGIGFRCVWDAH